MDKGVMLFIKTVNFQKLFHLRLYRSQPLLLHTKMDNLPIRKTSLSRSKQRHILWAKGKAIPTPPPQCNFYSSPIMPFPCQRMKVPKWLGSSRKHFRFHRADIWDIIQLIPRDQIIISNPVLSFEPSETGDPWSRTFYTERNTVIGDWTSMRQY